MTVPAIEGKVYILTKLFDIGTNENFRFKMMEHGKSLVLTHRTQQLALALTLHILTVIIFLCACS